MAALICAADFARSRQRQNAVAFLEEYADFPESHVERWRVTTDGRLFQASPVHYIRIHQSPCDGHIPNETRTSLNSVFPNRPPRHRLSFLA